MPSLLLLVPLWSFLPCFFQSCCHLWDGRFFPCIWDPLRHMVLYGWGEAVGAGGGSKVPQHLYSAQCCKVWKLQSGPGVSLPWRRQGPGPLEGQGPGPHCCCCLITCGHGCQSGWEARDMWAASLAANGFWNCGFSCHFQRSTIADTDSTFSSVLTPMCVPIHTHLGVQMHGIIWHPTVLWMFYQLLTEEETKVAFHSPIFCLT